MQILYYIYQQKQVNASLEQNWLKQLTQPKADAIRRIQVETKRHQSLLGLQLLAFGARQQLGLHDFHLDQIQFPKHRKPFCHSDIDFNISHSSELIVCAITQHGRIGVDVEKQRDIKPAVLRRYTSERERQLNPNPIVIWTQKEAVVKAADSGGIAAIHKVEIDNNSSHYDNVLWHLKRIEILPDYIVQVATEQPQQHITLTHVTLDDLTTENK